ncbi:MAG: hypothetical protein KGQ43_02750 [Acidobacteria bacterium]|nr:hypothetical protein [Acidobacteriota bacterium]
MITGVFIAAAAVCVLAIAAIVIGREARRLDAVAPRAVYDLDQAADFVADRLPEVTQARLTPDELQAMLALHMRWLHAQGLQPDRAVDKRQDIAELLLISEDQLSAYLLSEAEKSGVELLDDVDVVHVVRAHLAYFDAIGAVGPTASSTDL